MSLVKQYTERTALEDAESNEVEIDVEVTIELPEVKEVSQDEEYEADSEIAEYAEDLHEEEVERVEDERVMDEVVRHTASLEALIDGLEFGLESQKFDPQFAHTVSETLGTVSQELGDDTASVSIEDYSAGQLDQFYAVSLEDVREKIDKFNILSDQIMIRAMRAPFSAAIKARRAAVAEAFIKKGDALLARLSDAPSGKADISLKGLAKGVASKGSVPSNLLAQFKKDQAASNTLLSKFAPAGLDYSITLMKEIEAVVKKMRDKKEGKESIDAAVNAIGALKLPENSLPEGILSGADMVGNAYLDLKKTNQWADVNERYAPRFKKHSGTSGGETVSVSKADLVQMANLVKAYGVMLQKANEDLTKKASNVLTDAGNRSRNARNLRQGGWFLPILKRNARFQTLAKLSRSYPFDVASVINGSFKHGRASTQTLVNVVDRGIVALGKTKA